MTIADDWTAFVRDWCLESAPRFGQPYAIRALAALEKHWPERLGQLHGSGVRGIGAVVHPINLGTILADSCDCPGFARVLQRARNGEVGAVSELTFGARLKRSGFAPRFGEQVGGKSLDIAADVDATVVYIEIVAPELSDLDKEARSQITRAMNRLKAATGQHLRVELLTFPTDEAIERVRAGISSSPLGESVELPGIARWKLDSSPDSGPRTEFSWPANEYRASRMISAEYDHFTADVPYVLVVNTGATLLPPDGWTAAFARAFQPTRNRRVGATVAYYDYVLATDYSFRSAVRVLKNPYAHHPVPPRLLRALADLNQPIPGE